MRRGLLEAALLLAVAALLGTGSAALRRPPLPLRLPADFFRVESGARPILAADARARQAEGGYGFLDVRPSADYAAGHVAGALNLPADRIAAAHEAAAEWIEGIPLVLYGTRGAVNAVDTAAMLLAERGYGPLLILVEGYESWVDAGGPVERGASTLLMESDDPWGSSGDREGDWDEPDGDAGPETPGTGSEAGSAAEGGE